jgi:N-acetylmuramoyl-L-alanine amidase
VLASLKRVGAVHKREVQKANFVVLRSPDVPSILVETAYITNPDEEKKLNDPEYRGKLVDAILEGTRNYFRAAPPPGSYFALNKAAPTQHVVSRGETLAAIAQRHNVPLNVLKTANKLRDDGTVREGDVIKLPTSS